MVISACGSVLLPVPKEHRAGFAITGWPWPCLSGLFVGSWLLLRCPDLFLGAPPAHQQGCTTPAVLQAERSQRGLMAGAGRPRFGDGKEGG